MILVLYLPVAAYDEPSGWVDMYLSIHIYPFEIIGIMTFSMTSLFNISMSTSG